MSRQGYPEYESALEVRKAGVIKEYEDELIALSATYADAKRSITGRTDGKDLIDLAKMLRSYKAGEPPDKAVYIIAQATMLVDKLVKPFVVVANYENREKQLDKLRK